MGQQRSEERSRNFRIIFFTLTYRDPKVFLSFVWRMRVGSTMDKSPSMYVTVFKAHICIVQKAETLQYLKLIFVLFEKRARYVAISERRALILKQ